MLRFHPDAALDWGIYLRQPPKMDHGGEGCFIVPYRRSTTILPQKEQRPTIAKARDIVSGVEADLGVDIEARHY
jgi:hypothetical protein